MVPLGRDFKAPPQRAKTQWLKVELLHSFSITFEVPVWDAGGPGPRPGKLNEVVAFLVAQGRDRAEVEERLESLRRLRAD